VFAYYYIYFFVTLNSGPGTKSDNPCGANGLIVDVDEESAFRPQVFFRKSLKTWVNPAAARPVNGQQ